MAAFVTATETCGICGEPVLWWGAVGQGWVHRDQAAKDHRGYIGTHAPVRLLTTSPVTAGEVEVTAAAERRVVDHVVTLTEDALEGLREGADPPDLPATAAAVARLALEMGWDLHVRRVYGRERAKDEVHDFGIATVAGVYVHGPAPVAWWAAWQFRDALSSGGWGFDVAWLRQPALVPLKDRDLKALIVEPRAANAGFVGLVNQPAKPRKAPTPRAKKDKENAG